MKVPVTLNVAVLAVVATLFYTWVGQLVPQKEVLPPEVVEIAQDVSTDEMVAIGQKIYDGKGLCTTCHGTTDRFPPLDGIATRAATRVPGLDQVQYLAQSLYEPNAYLVPGYAPGMPAMDKPPIGLSNDEIKAVIAYLQTLGGEATITMATSLAYAEGAEVTSDVDPEGGEDVVGIGPDEGPAATQPGQAPVQAVEPATPVAAASGPADLLASYGCTDCHRVDQPGRLEAVSLVDVGERLSTAEILRNLTNHRPPLPPEYSRRVTLSEVQAMTEYLSGLRGGQG